MDKFNTEVETSFYCFKENAEIATIKVKLPWSLEEDRREWGVKELYPYLWGPFLIDVEIDDYSNEDVLPLPTPKTIVLDLEKLKKSHTAGNSIAPFALEIWLDKNFDVDYSKSELSFYFIEPK